MVRSNAKNPANNNDDAWLIFGAIGAGLGAWGLTYGALTVAGQDPPANPVDIVLGLATGDLAWSTAATVTAVTIVVAGLLLIALGALAVVAVRGRPLDVDRAARHMANRRDIDAYTYKQVAKKARRLTAAGPSGGIGLPLGFHLPSKAKFWSSWQDMLVLVAGPRTMKSSSYTIPLALAAPGACFITENKRGVLDHTRAARAEVGEVWVFDPQGVAGEPVSWWWNPLTYVTDESKAEKMAAQIAESSRTPGGKGDPYFDGEGVNLLHLMLLAAATDHQPITQIYTWLSRPDEDRPAEVLAGAGYDLQAESLRSLIATTSKQRDGIYGTARALVGFLRNRQMMAWVTPPTSGGVREFDPHAYVRSTDTLYALSNDGRTSAGPLVGALTLAVFEAAETYAATCPGDRLPTPLVGLLDEAANVCRFKDLDSKYSYYGSRGIVLMTVLQSPDQAEEIWGKHGWNKLWSAANVKIYGGGVSNTDFLRQVSDLIGTYDHHTGSTSTGRGGRSRSRSVTERPILSVSELGAMPTGRAVILANGTRPALVKVVPWFAQDKKTQATINASLAEHDRHTEPAPAVASTTVGGSPWNVGPIER
ncbi:type IV secretory system conjugative DNA transfer family protein [Solicola sp. PLA-1-18]|uniref:type IV secretory system conjugative DNA transfer family protein n=1 Tax=Solicola sp. PLA-1-18 TaxID=3380532 RepID=UPI003B78D061